MKKLLFTALAAVALSLCVACGNNKNAEPAADTTVCAQVKCDKQQCDAACCQCSDECKAAKCENCTKCGTPACCGENAGKCCKGMAADSAKCCKMKGEEAKCCKAEGADSAACCKKKAE